MTLDEARAILPLFADGELDPARAAELEALLAASPDLRAELQRWRSLRRCVGRIVNGAPVPATLGPAVRERLGHATRRRRKRILRLVTTLTAAAAVVALGVTFWPTPTHASTPLVAADDFANVYLRCGVTMRHRGIMVPLDDPDAARRALDQREPFRVLVPNLASLGYKLDGVCGCFHAGKVRAIHVFYRKDGPTPVVISFFSVDQRVRLAGAESCPRCAMKNTSYQVAEYRKIVVCKWDEQAHSYAVCSEMPADQLRHLADEVQLALARPMIFALAHPEH